MTEGNLGCPTGPPVDRRVTNTGHSKKKRSHAISEGKGGSVTLPRHIAGVPQTEVSGLQVTNNARSLSEGTGITGYQVQVMESTEKEEIRLKQFIRYLEQEA